MLTRLFPALAAALCITTPAVAWEFTLDGTDRCVGLRALRVDPAGDVLALGFEYLDCHADARGPNFIVKVSGETGQLVWRRDLPDFLFADVLRLDSVGNPFVGQYARSDEDDTWFQSQRKVSRLSGETGEPLWSRLDVFPWAITWLDDVLVTSARQLIQLSGRDGSEGGAISFPDQARLVGVQPEGDAIAEQRIEDDPSTPQYDPHTRVLRLSWRQDDVVWIHDFLAPAAPHFQQSLVDGRGDVVVAGTESEAGFMPQRWVVSLLDGGSGARRWLTVLDREGPSAVRAGDVRALSVDRVGGVVLAGNAVFGGNSADFAVAKFSRADGHPLWQWSEDGGTGLWDSAIAMVTDTAGDVVAVGASGRPRKSRAPVVKLAGANGAVVWQKATAFRGWTGWDTALLVDTDERDDVIVGGDVRNESVVIAKFSGRTGGDFPCGNGILDPSESCDDGNTTPDDGCESDCTVSASCDDGDPCSQNVARPSGCEFLAIGGPEGQRCVLQHHYPPSACERLPRGVRKAIEHARRLLDRSLSAPRGMLERRIQASLDRAARRIARHGANPACRAAVVALLADAAARSTMP